MDYETDTYSLNDILEDVNSVMDEDEKVEDSPVDDDLTDDDTPENDDTDSQDLDDVPDDDEPAVEPPKKFLDMFDTEEDARNYLMAQQREIDRVAQEKALHEQQRAREAQRQQIEEQDRQFVDNYTQLILQGKGDEAALYMQRHILSQSAQIAEQIVNTKLAQMADYYEGRAAFLRKEEDADLHGAVEYVEALIRAGLTETQAKQFLRGASQSMGLKPTPKEKPVVNVEKRKEAAKRAKRDALAEEPTASRRKEKKDSFDQFADDIVTHFFG